MAGGCARALRANGTKVKGNSPRGHSQDHPDSSTSGNRWKYILQKTHSYFGDRSYIKINSLYLLCFPVERGDETIQTLVMGGTRRCLLPFTVTEAEVLLSPVSQVYSPLSVTSSLRMAKVCVVALCSMLYLFPSVSSVEPLSQVTLQSALDVSQVRVTSSPSLASQLSSSFLNVTGAAAGKNRYTSG